MITEFAAKTGVSVEDILGRNRTARASEAREMYYYVLLSNDFSITEIARLTDRTYHTVLSGLKRIESLLESRDPVVTRLFNLTKNIKR
jgi:chromosomal replication initiation ATPase DnaA